MLKPFLVFLVLFAEECFLAGHGACIFGEESVRLDLERWDSSLIWRADQLAIHRLVFLLFEVVPIQLDQSLVGVGVVFVDSVLVGVAEVEIAKRGVLQLVLVFALPHSRHYRLNVPVRDSFLTPRDFRIGEHGPQLRL